MNAVAMKKYQTEEKSSSIEAPGLKKLIIKKEGKEPIEIPLEAGWRAGKIEYKGKEKIKIDTEKEEIRDVYAVDFYYRDKSKEITIKNVRIEVGDEEAVIRTQDINVYIPFDPSKKIAILSSTEDDQAPVHPEFLDMNSFLLTRKALATIKTPSRTITIKPAKQKKQEKITLEQRLSESAEEPIITVAQPKSIDVTMPKIEPEIEIKEIDLPPELKKKPKRYINLDTSKSLEKEAGEAKITLSQSERIKVELPKIDIKTPEINLSPDLESKKKQKKK